MNDAVSGGWRRPHAQQFKTKAPGTPPPPAVGPLLLRLRRERGLSLSAAARAAGIAPSMLLRLETGERSCALATLAAVARALGLTRPEREAVVEAAGFPRGEDAA